MFTGIIEATAKVLKTDTGCLVLERPRIFDDCKFGSSIAISGVCLTVTRLDDCSLTFDVMPETVAKTTIGDLKMGDSVNLERALPAHGRFEGHVVQGHVEGVGEIVSVPSSILNTASPQTSSIPRPLPPEEEGGNRIEHTCRPRNKLFFAREMRKNPTEAEGLLWEHLRHDALGIRFRRQFLCAGAIFDFYCPEQRIALEIDGGIHLSENQRKYDRERDEYFLEEHKISTFRFANEQVLHDINSILSEIKKHIHSPPPREEGVGVEEFIEGKGQGVGEDMEEGIGVEEFNGGESRGGGDVRLSIRVPFELRMMIVLKGSVAVDGVSLTVADTGPETFIVALIPTTLQSTTLGGKRRGDRVNIETDILVRTLIAAGERVTHE